MRRPWTGRRGPLRARGAHARPGPPRGHPCASMQAEKYFESANALAPPPTTPCRWRHAYRSFSNLPAGAFSCVQSFGSVGVETQAAQPRLKRRPRGCSGPSPLRSSGGLPRRCSPTRKRRRKSADVGEKLRRSQVADQHPLSRAATAKLRDSFQVGLEGGRATSRSWPRPRACAGCATCRGGRGVLKLVAHPGREARPRAPPRRGRRRSRPASRHRREWAELRSGALRARRRRSHAPRSASYSAPRARA